MKYRVEYMVTLTGTMDVEAESEDEAKDKVGDATGTSLCAGADFEDLVIRDCEPVDDEGPTHDPPKPHTMEETVSDTLRYEIERAINRHSAENGSNTPDYLLADYLVGCLEVFDKAVRERERWYGRKRNQRVLADGAPNNAK